jgi:hypothetical protein
LGVLEPGEIGQRSAMILDRWYQPADDELIYYYCRLEAFLEILRSRIIWLSGSYVMNGITPTALLGITVADTL